MSQNINSKNLVTAYNIYMIVGSYFKSTKCKSALREGQLRLAYADVKRDNQYVIEERLIKYIENRMIGVVPDDIFDEDVVVSFKNNDEKGYIEVIFKGNTFVLLVFGVESSKGVNYDYILKTDDVE